MQTVFQVGGIHDPAEPGRAESSENSGADTEDDQERNHGHESQNFGQNQVRSRVDTHDVERVNLLGDTHGPDLGGDVGTDLSGQDETHDGRRELQQEDFTGGISYNEAWHPRTFDVQLNLDTDNRTDEERNQQYNTDGIDTQLVHFIDVLLEIHAESFRASEDTSHEHQVFPEGCDGSYHTVFLIFATKVRFFGYIILKDRMKLKLSTT